MKSNSNKLSFILLMFLFLFYSCGADEENIQFPLPGEPAPGLSEPVVTFSTTEIELDENKGSETALAFSWTAATDDPEANIDYTLYINTEGKDLFKGIGVDVGNILTYSYTHNELNDLLLRNLEVRPGQTVKVNACIYASDPDDVYGSSLSGTTVLTISTQIPSKLYLLGGAYDSWDFSAAAIFTQTRKGEYKAEEVTLKFGSPNDAMGFKLYLKEEEWEPFFGQDMSSEDFGDMKLITSGDSQFYPLEYGYESGIYTIQVDINAMKLTLTKTGDVEPEIDYNKAVFMLGDGTPFGWGFEKENAMKMLGNNVHEYERVHLSADEYQGFKFFVGIDNWGNEYIRDTSNPDNYWAIKPADGVDAQFYLYELNQILAGQGKPAMPSGYYKIRVDLDNLTMDVTCLEAD